MSAEAKLLVVDDEFNILELLATSLRFAGFEVVTAGNGREALEKAHAETPDLIVLDVMMPGMDGFEVTRRLRENGTTTPRALPDRKGRHRGQGDRSGCRRRRLRHQALLTRRGNRPHPRHSAPVAAASRTRTTPYCALTPSP